MHSIDNPRYIGMLFQEEMIKSLLAGIKTVTRRKFDVFSTEKITKSTVSKYGDVGDIIYVKETHYVYGKWIANGISKKTGRQKFAFQRLRNDILYFDTVKDTPIRKNNERVEGWYKKSSLFMEQQFARIFLQRTDGLQLEKIQDITEAECKNEGVARLNDQVYYNYITKKYSCLTAKESFKTLWCAINSTELAGWVTRIPFERIHTKKVANQ